MRVFVSVMRLRVFGSRIWCLRFVLFLAFVCSEVGYGAAQTDSQDYAALSALTKDWGNLPSSWTGGDPCGSKWEGITCINSHISSITLSSVGVTGKLSGDLASLSDLETLDLSYNKELTGSLPSTIGKLSKLTNLILLGCGFSGPIPDSIGSLSQLVYLSLNSNKFTGSVPASIGNLKKLYWLDLSDNQLSGSIPVSDGTTPGLDLLLDTKHFHFGMNRLSGSIPSSLFSADMTMIHALFDNNNLTGSIPSTIALVQTLEAIRFDRNSLNGTLPSNLNELTHVNELVLSNNAFTGPVPNLTDMSNLNYLDMSNNSFEATNVSQWLTTLQSLTTVMMERTGLEGQLPVEFFSIPQLQTVVMKGNQLSGELDIGSTYSRQLELIDLQSNSIDAVTVPPGYNFTLVLADNPLCGGATFPYCNNQQDLGSPYTTPVFCVPPKCSSGQTSSPTCKCAHPYTGTLIFRAPSFSASGNPKYFTDLQQSLLSSFASLKLPVDSVSLSDVATDAFGYLNMHLAIFPAGPASFNKTGVLSLGFVLSNQTYKPSKEYGPYVFIADIYTNGASPRSKSSSGVIIGAAVGGSVLVLLLICAGGYACYQKRRAEKAKQQTNSFVSWEKQQTDLGLPHMKGARYFSFKELQKCTNNFSEDNNIGAGGYGKVYKGTLEDNQIVAIKRSQEGSMQGTKEFKNEIELLSRVHHKNLVKLVGFCCEQGEQMLVYEFVSKGTLTESLSGKNGIQLDWIRRLMITLGAARGLHYLHELADPPIIHRDIKSTNILLDERLNAKVADFGLSKLFGDTEKGHMTTQVKGTMGYLDPEYFMTNQVTEKSDVFSFGVVMMEMVTARMPIHKGKYVVKEIKTTIDRTKDLYNLEVLMDPVLLTTTTLLVGLEKFVDLALKCVEEAGVDRPTMGELVKEIENIVKLAGLNPNLESASVAYSGYEGVSGEDVHIPYTNDYILR
ncbi:leucine-rich repeat receptor protein kinase HPCA1-like [Silene latifolia]|uniref:leucine-rich repeat receptor protein kinase HPCA1-like n=1 Tax=Silene latifolia TaxID=37657 RepID=UPI003D76D50C